MSPRVKTGTPTEFSRAVIDAISHLIRMSGLPVREVVKRSGFSTNYFYVRMRHEAPFNTNDIAAIAEVLEIEPKEIIDAATETLNAARQNAPANNQQEMALAARRVTPREQQMLDEYNSFDS